MTRSLRAGALLACLLVAACPPAPPSTDTAADEQAIRALVEGMNQAVSAQNDSAIAALYSDKGILLPPGMRKVTGRENIRAFWKGLWGMKPSLTMMPVTITISGDLAVEEGNYMWSIPLANGGEEKEDGKVLVTWRRTDTSWEIVQHMWNADSRAKPVGG